MLRWPTEFNASKSKCIVCAPRKKAVSDYLFNVEFTLTGKVTEIVKSWPQFD